MYQTGKTGWRKHFDFIVLDALCLQVAVLLAYYIRHRSAPVYLSKMNIAMAMVYFFVSIAVTSLGENFKNVLKRGYFKELVATAKAATLVILIGSFFLYITQVGGNYARTTFLVTWGLYIVFSFCLRNAWKKYLIHRKGNVIPDRSLLIVTSKALLGKTIERLEDRNYGDYYISGAVLLEKDYKEETVLGVPIVTTLEGLIPYVKKEWVDEILFKIPEGQELPKEEMNQLVDMGVTVHLKLARIDSKPGHKQYIDSIAGFTVLTRSVNVARPSQIFAKRCLDILGGVVGCLVTGGLMIVLGPFIYLSSKGPIIFQQIRVGKGGKKFKIYKFRSMYLDAEERKQELMEQNQVNNDLMFKIEDDPRIIKGIGHIIRNYSLDEFPQFWNVLKGEMSLVGTRPPTESEWEKYELHHRARMAIKPGITGMWQVSGRSKITNFEDVVALDREYITNWGFAMDIKILLKTILVVLGKDGSM